MIRFSIRLSATENVFLDMDEAVAVGFKKSNPMFLFGSLEVGRSTEFSVPATDRNRLALGFADDPMEWGDALRRRYPSQMVYSGGVVNGQIAVTEYEGDTFKCVFYYDVNDALLQLNGLKLKDCRCTLPSVLWDKASAGATIYGANAANIPSVALVEYQNHWMEMPNPSQYGWTYLPSVNLDALVEDLLSEMEVRHDLHIDSSYRLIFPSIHGATSVTGSVSKSGSQAGTIAAALQQYFEFDTSDKLWVQKNWNALVPTGVWQHPCWSLIVKQDCKVTFPSDFPDNYSLWYKESHLLGYDFVPVTDRYANHSPNSPLRYEGQPLAGRTVEMKKGTKFFVLDETAFGVATGYANGFGWFRDAAPFSFYFSVERSGDITLGEMWRVQDNMPDMTIAELLQSAALLSGRYLVWDNDAIKAKAATYAPPVTVDLKDVISIDAVKRNVPAFGDNAKTMTVDFDSEEYVTIRNSNVYSVDNENLDGEETRTIKFSEGEYMDGGAVRVEDVEIGSDGNGKPTGSKVTVSLAGQGKVLAHVSIAPMPLMYAVARRSTCVKMKVKMDVADFADISYDVKFRWRGINYLWTSAEWSQGVATLTLQAL